MTQWSRRNLLRTAGAAGLVPLISGLGTSASFADEPIELQVGVQRGAIGAIKVGLAEVQAKYGLRYDQRTFNDATSVILAMAQKELDLGNITAQHIVRAMDQGIKLSVVIGYAGGYNVIVANPDVPVEKGDAAGFIALVNKRKSQGSKVKFGVPTGSQQHLKLITFLTKNGLSPEKDVDIVNVTFPDHVRALDGRQVDFVVTISSFAALAMVKHVGKLFEHLYGDGYGRWELGFAVRNDLIENKPAVVQKVVDSFYGAMGLFMGDVSKRIAYEKQKSGFPPAAVELDQREFVHITPHIVIEDIKRTAKEMANVGWTKRDLSGEVEKYVNFTFLEKTTGQPESKLRTF